MRKRILLWTLNLIRLLQVSIKTIIIMTYTVIVKAKKGTLWYDNFMWGYEIK